ncbi:hypothetical protein PV371_16135 [Streptomyces sp. TX20-6-3]|uniref:hypothetical protein n=1 Tax=Streptomyces sp. TX20-6-3 TaxID=3028705 RepID=UPI0029A9404F|nr:hypothetical protein [Streptomyces sp. TX20-6-3]MDX2561180.1 hypothetical protein [Streptomyces sp. TX20-6-3]
MGFTSAWAISAHTDEDIADLAPRLLPAMRADRESPDAARRWQDWRRAPLPDHRTWYENYGPEIESFHELAAPGAHVDDMCGGRTDPSFYVVDDVWDGRSEDDMFLSVHSKEYAVASLLHALGPSRAALLPGWCGTFLLTPAQVAESLPHVERAFTFTPDQRAAAEAQDWLYYAPGEESVLDGPLRLWRTAARTGMGLCGLSVHLT